MKSPFPPLMMALAGMLFVAGSISSAELLDLSTRQIFLDDSIVAKSHGAEKILHQARTLPERVVACDTPAETARRWTDIPSVIREEDGTFRMWYATLTNPLAQELPGRKYSIITLYAESKDGLTWTKPALGHVEFQGDQSANNIVSSAWLRTVLPNPKGEGYVALEGRPYKWFTLDASGRKVLSETSLEEWISIPKIMGLTEARANTKSQSFISDEARLMWDPVTNRFVASIKTGKNVPGSVEPERYRRAVALASSANGGDAWTFSGAIQTTDLEDDAYVRSLPYVDTSKPMWAELDNMPMFRYENVIIGLMTLMYMYNGDSGGVNSEIFLTWSKDGTVWERQKPRAPFIAAPEAAPHFGFFKAGVTPPIRVGGELWFYHGWGGKALNSNNAVKDAAGKGIGLSKLRVDGFASLHAGEAEAVVETKPFAHRDKPLLVNGDFSKGECVVELVGNTPEKPVLLTSKPLTSDSVSLPVEWTEKAGGVGEVFLRFRFTQGDLYSFGF